MTERQVTRSDAEYPHRLDGIDGMPDTLWTHGAVSLDPDRAAKGARLGQAQPGPFNPCSLTFALTL